MTREEFNATSADVLAELSAESPDTGKISGFLANLRDGFNDEVSRAESAEKARDDFSGKVKSLQEANMNLFLKLGDIPKQENGVDLTPKQPEKIDFNSLFNDKGELI